MRRSTRSGLEEQLELPNETGRWGGLWEQLYKGTEQQELQLRLWDTNYSEL